MHRTNRRTLMLGGLAGAGLVAAGCASAPGSRSGTDLRRASGVGDLPTLYYLGQSKLFVMDAPLMQPRVLVDLDTGPRGVNDGIAIDHANRRIYWTNMGRASQPDGFIMRCGFDGGDLTTIVPPGRTHTPKQLKLDAAGGWLYWSDREGMAVMRCRLDGTGIETLVRTGDPKANVGDQTRWCVGIAFDPARRMLYWTQKGGDNAYQGVIRRCPADLPAGMSPASRTDIETLFARLPEPIDLDLDLALGQIYWADRGDNTISRAPMDKPAGADARTRTDREVLVRGLKEAIGIALDLPRNRMAFTSLGGEVGLATLDGRQTLMLAEEQGLLTGIAWG